MSIALKWEGRGKGACIQLKKLFAGQAILEMGRKEEGGLQKTGKLFAGQECVMAAVDPSQVWVLGLGFRVYVDVFQIAVKHNAWHLPGKGQGLLIIYQHPQLLCVPLSQ